MFEHKSKPMIPRKDFILRLAGSVSVAMAIAAVSLLAGMIGYKYFEGYDWTGSFLNAAMILGGMGQVDPIRTEGGKIFAGLYALYSGLWVVASMGIILTPVFHRMLHHFHAERTAAESKSE